MLVNRSEVSIRDVLMTTIVESCTLVLPSLVIKHNTVSGVFAQSWTFQHKNYLYFQRRLKSIVYWENANIQGAASYSAMTFL